MPVKQHIHQLFVSTSHRYCHRIFPAEYAFKANEENFKKYLKLLIDERVPTDAPCSVNFDAL